jgi:uncharacterized membrane protein YraQ (UPF0718 family)
MSSDNAIMIALAAVLLVVAALRGQGLWLAGLQAGARSFLDLLPVLLLSFAIGGLIQILIPREEVSRWMGSEAGLRGIILGGAVGALLPGPPYALYPMVVALLRSSASVGAVVGLLTGKVLWNVHYMPHALATLGPRVTLLQFGSTLLFPPLAGLIAQHLLNRLL